jgi:hypothetical protein
MWRSVSDAQLDTFFGVSAAQWSAKQWKKLQKGETLTNDGVTTIASVMAMIDAARNKRRHEDMANDNAEAKAKNDSDSHNNDDDVYPTSGRFTKHYSADF